MRLMIILALLICVPALALARNEAPQKPRKLFPYNYTIDDLPNGLRLITVPTDYPNLVALYLVVNTGSRNEVEVGKSGFAHFFEHMMFRGSENYTAEQREAIFKRAGAETNAYTSDDRTVYHAVFSKDDLDEIMKMEADRFLRLKYALPEFQTESLAVKGEYDKNSANPFAKLYEVLRETAFKTHPYSHTTMGYLKDIQDMPNQFAYSQEFFKRFYRPEYTTVLLVGDVTQKQSLELTKKYFGDWKRGDYVTNIPVEPPQTEPRTGHIDWPSPTLPIVAVAFRGPAYSDEKKDKLALDLLAQVAFGENSELYQKLVLKEQKVDVLGPDFSNQVDPELFVVLARVKDVKDVDYVRDQIQATFKRYTTELIPAAKLEATRSRIRYSFAMAMNSSAAIASTLAPFISLRRTPDTIDKSAAMMDTITAQDVRDLAAKYFRDESRTIITLSTKTKEGATTKTQEDEE
ncbi:MAG TPA: pitrilysin family protein [Pyrinomonadaceae bacterium]|nr:pitrilysin family protein [Pyrinomonadaceae bacterium]